MRIAIIQFPGSNCERETILAVKRAGMVPEEFLWNESKEKLATCAGYIIVGGFSYEDRSRAGILAALDPLMEVIKQQSELGKPILGICNGAQILVESGLVPGVQNNQVALSLTDNKRIQQGQVLGTGYYNAWVNIRVSDHYQYNAFTRLLSKDKILRIPVAHGEGRFVIPPALLMEMQVQGLNVFQYCDAKGNIIDEFPINPNGSINNIAAISNKKGNVMAMMPHPERTTEGDVIFYSMRQYIEEGAIQSVMPLHYCPRIEDIQQYHPNGHECIVDLMITDNQSLSVENVLNHHLGISAKVKRQTHWEIVCDTPETLKKIRSSGVLYNDRKEKVLTGISPYKKTLLIRAREDMQGLQKCQVLKNHYSIEGIHAIRHGILWRIDAEDALFDSIIHSHILFNPCSHDCYYY